MADNLSPKSTYFYQNRPEITPGYSKIADLNLFAQFKFGSNPIIGDMF